MTDRMTVAADAPLIAGGTSTGAVPASDREDHEPMPARQAAIPRQLSEETGAAMDGEMTRSQAGRRIANLRDRTGR